VAWRQRRRVAPVEAAAAALPLVMLPVVSGSYLVAVIVVNVTVANSAVPGWVGLVPSNQLGTGRHARVELAGSLSKPLVPRSWGNCVIRGFRGPVPSSLPLWDDEKPHR
jgi:hypothetical protein